MTNALWFRSLILFLLHPCYSCRATFAELRHWWRENTLNKYQRFHSEHVQLLYISPKARQTHFIASTWMILQSIFYNLVQTDWPKLFKAVHTADGPSQIHRTKTRFVLFMFQEECTNARFQCYFGTQDDFTSLFDDPKSSVSESGLRLLSSSEKINRYPPHEAWMKRQSDPDTASVYFG